MPHDFVKLLLKGGGVIALEISSLLWIPCSIGIVGLLCLISHGSENIHEECICVVCPFHSRFLEGFLVGGSWTTNKAKV